MPTDRDALPAIDEFGTAKVALEITSFDFWSDHNAMTDHADGWEYEGKPFLRPIWHVDDAKNGILAPTSHTKGTQLKLQATLTAASLWVPYGILALEPGTLDGRLRVDGRGTIGDTEFKTRFRLKHIDDNGGTGDDQVSMPGLSPLIVSEKTLPDRVGILEMFLLWVYEITHSRYVDYDDMIGSKLVVGTGPHKIFLTYGPPVTPEQRSGNVDLPKRIYGPTLRRMERSVRLIEGLAKQKSDTNHPHAVVEALVMKTFKGMITGTPSTAVPEEFNHPSYLSERSSFPILKKIGAWPMMDHIDELGECQAESRFILGVAGQLGLPGDIELVYVWTTHDSLDTPVVAVGRLSDGKKKLEAEGKGDLWRVEDERGNITRELALLERDHATRKNEGSRYTGTVNYFEACVRVTHGTEPDENGHSVPKVRYYAPGAGVYKNEMEVMTIYSLCEIKYENGQIIIEKVLKEYTDNWWKKPKKK